MSDGSYVPVPRARLAPWLVEPMRRNKGTYAKVALAAAMINIFALVTALFTMTVYDRVVPNNATESLVALSIGLAIVIVFDFALRTLRAYFVDVAGANIDLDTGAALFDRLLRLRLDKRKGSNGALASLVRELDTLREFFASATLTAVVDVPFIALTLAVIAIIGGPVVYVPLAAVPLVMLTAWATHPALDRLSAKALGQGMVKQGVLVETIGALETVKASGAGPLLSHRWLEAVDDHSGSALRQRMVSAISLNVATAANTICYAGIVIVGVGLVADNRLTVGALIACSILGGRAVAPLAQIAQLLSRISATRTAYRQLDALMQEEPEGAGGGLPLALVQGRVEFRGVGFSYPGAKEPALSGISFTLQPGERVALLGRVGSGKSTIARLVLGLYEAQEGLVLVDGTDVRQLDPAQFRRHIGVAMQDSVLLTGTVRENIALGREDVDDAELLRVAQLSGAHDFMGAIAGGYDLRLADRGEGLSGGQRQAISLARALAGRPALLIFDEPTSAMDGATESGLIERLNAEVQGRTLLVITHRPPLLRLVNRVIIVDKGKIVADGPRDKIMKQLASQAAQSKAA